MAPVIVIGSVAALISASVPAASGQVALHAVRDPLGASASQINSINPVSNVRSVKFSAVIGIAPPALGKSSPPELTHQPAGDPGLWQRP